MLEEEKQGVCIQQFWPLSLVTDYRSLMLPQKLQQLVEMNHPSVFFCKPSITSDSAPQTLTPPAHLHRLAELHIRRGSRTTSRSGRAVQTNQAEKAPPRLHPVPLTASLLFPLSLSCCASLIFCHLVLYRPFFFLLLFLSVDFHSPSPPRVAAPPPCISLVGHLPARRLRGSKSLLTF